MFSIKHFLFPSRLGWLIYYILNSLAFQIYKTNYYQIFFLVGLGVYIMYVYVYFKNQILLPKKLYLSKVWLYVFLFFSTLYK